MIYSGTYSTLTATLLGNTSGLVGTVAVRVVDGTGSSIVTRTTSGITEPVAGSGFYVATIALSALSSAPSPGHYFVMWDDGSTSPGHVATEDLILHQTTTLSAALRSVASAANSHNAENVSVGLFVA
jgi:hypothetical protein